MKTYKVTITRELEMMTITETVHFTKEDYIKLLKLKDKADLRRIREELKQLNIK